jgi:SAM-dependent methyltransferase
MDARTLQNYTAHADPIGASDMSRAVQKRTEGPAYEMKSFHNDVKDALLRGCIAKIPDARILDVGCGRGGDLWKYARIGGIFSVVGIDICEAGIHEANLRYETVKKHHHRHHSSGLFRACFHVIDVRDPVIPWPVAPMSVDVVSFMFCLHYMFDSDETLIRVLRRSYEALVPGGYCIGTLADGDAILEYTKIQPPIEKKNVCQIIMDVAGPGTYQMTLLDTVIDDIGTYEYISRESQFVRCAEIAGFVPVTSYNLDGRVDGNEDVVFKRFMPRYSGSHCREYESVSSLYSTFCLRKILS